MSATRRNGQKDGMPELTREEGRALFEQACRYYLDMDADEFLRKYEAGELDEDNGGPEVEHVAMLIPFVR